MSTIQFQTEAYKIDSHTILRLPKAESVKLPSRGMVMIKGKINGVEFQTPLEPDGKGSHWLNVDKEMQEAVKVEEGDSVKLTIESTNEWPEPKIPDDLMQALAIDSEIDVLWNDVTPMARWDWLRWIGSTKNPETRKHRIEVAASKLKAGMRRPCCFNRSMCCVPDVSKNGVLLEPNLT